MANTLLTPTAIAKHALVILENNLVFANKIYRDDKAFEAKIGASHTLRLPNRFTSNTGKNLNVGEMAEPSKVLSIDTQRHVDFYFDSDDLTLTIEDFAERYLKPAMSQLANDIEADIADNYKEIFHSVGTPGTTPSSFATSFQLVGTRMDLMGMPRDNRCLVLDPDGYWTLANGFHNMNWQSEAAGAAMRSGSVPKIAGFEVYESQNIKQHTVGTYGGTSLTEGAGADGDTTTDTDGWSSGATTLNQGDILTIADVNAVNPQTRSSAGFLQQFVVTADISDTAGDIDFAHRPTIKTSGAYQTVDAAPADEKAVTVLGDSATAYPQNLAFHRDAFALAMADLVMPQGVDFAARARYKGLSLRIVRDYDINSDSYPVRIDVLYGTDAIYPELAVRLWG